MTINKNCMDLYGPLLRNVTAVLHVTEVQFELRDTLDVISYNLYADCETLMKLQHLGG